MKDYLLVFRSDHNNMPEVTPEEAQAETKRWMDWIGGIAAQNRLTNRGNRLYNSGKVLKSGGVVTNGPFIEIKESIGGYTLVKAESYDQAVELAKGCPILTAGGNVEIREISNL